MKMPESGTLGNRNLCSEKTFSRGLPFFFLFFSSTAFPFKPMILFPFFNSLNVLTLIKILKLNFKRKIEPSNT